MDELLTDQQQAEAVRGWLRQNGLWLAGGVVLGLGALAGWNQWQRYQESQAEAASAVYDAVLKAVNESRLDDATARLQELTDEFPRTIYADQGRLALARLQLDRNDADGAAGLLREVATGSGSPEYRDIARLRLARLLIYQEKTSEARQVLDDIKSAAFGPAVHEIRGDALVAEGKPEEARAEYQLALAGSGAGVNEGLVQAKLDSLGGPREVPGTGVPAAAGAAPADGPAAAPGAAPGATPAVPAEPAG